MRSCPSVSLPAALAALLLHAAPLAATNTGQLAGRVIDFEGIALPGVSVAAGSPSQIGGEQRAATDGEGMFLYPRLAPGLYTVRLELDGFVTQELTGVRVRLDHLTEIEVVLPLAEFGESLTVSELAPVVDPVQVSTGQTFGSDYLENATVGVAARWSYQEILTQAAGASSIGILQGAPAMSVHGSTATENAFLIDGLDTTNPYWGTARTMLPLDSIGEINFETGGFGAEYGRATGGVVNAVTKSGGNSLAGTFDVRYSGSDLETSGRHYDADEQPSESWIAGATLGGPIAVDRAWYFAALEGQDWEWTPTGAPTSFESAIARGFVKVTSGWGDGWLGVGKLHLNPQEYRNVYASRFRAPESTGRYDADEDILQAEVSSIRSENLLWEVQAGFQRIEEIYGPISGDSAAFPHFNLATGRISGNAFEQWSRDIGRDQIGTSLTRFVSDAAGSHELETGAEVHATTLDLSGCTLGIPGGGQCAAGAQSFGFLDLVDETGGAAPFWMQVDTASPPQKVDGRQPFVYVQDTWRPRSDLSLQLGLRWDRASYDDDAGREVADFEMIQPRLGVAWDVAGDGRSLLRASWGRYMHGSFLRLPRLAAPVPAPSETWGSCSYFGFGDPVLCQAVAAGLGLPWRADPAGWDPAGWLLGGITGAAPTRIAPDLEPTHSDTLIVGFERELMRRTSLELVWVDKETRDIFDDTCVGNYPTPTAGADCSSWIVFNIPQARREYQGWILKLESRALDRLHLLASYTHADSRGSIDSGSITDAAFDVYPFHFDNYWFDLEPTHQVKVNGYVLLPHDLTLAFGGRWDSGFKWSPYDDTVEGMPFGLAAVESGGREGEDFEQLDLQLTKGFRLSGARLELIATVINALDSEVTTGVCGDVDGCVGFALGDPIAWQQPRAVELGLRLELGRD